MAVNRHDIAGADAARAQVIARRLERATPGSSNFRESSTAVLSGEVELALRTVRGSVFSMIRQGLSCFWKWRSRRAASRVKSDRSSSGRATMCDNKWRIDRPSVQFSSRKEIGVIGECQFDLFGADACVESQIEL